MAPLGAVHLASALLALLVGAIVLLRNPKGTKLHRRLGWIFAGSMLVLNVTALMIYRLFGGFGPFHVAALVSLVGISLGVWSAIRGRRSRLARDLPARAGWVERHYYYMTWSYIGLVAAALSETATRLPALRPRPGAGMMFGIAVGVATMIVVAIGAVLVRSKVVAQLRAAGVQR